MSKKCDRRFTAHDFMVDLVEADFNILPILSRFSIPLGFGTKSIEEVCGESRINCDVFLLIVNFIMTGSLDSGELSPESLEGVVDFLHKSHDYFLVYKFPHIRANLVSALDVAHSDINPAIVNFFDVYVNEVKKHFDYEESTVFPYIRSLVRSEDSSKFKIDIFRKHHDEMGEKLADLKNLILRFYTTSMPDRMYDVLVDVFNCEEDLNTHRDIENHLLVPATALLEKRVRKSQTNSRK